MGTNYYLTKHGTDACPHCGRSDDAETLHIGKSSVGWCFSLHVIPEQGINDLNDWLPLFKKCPIRNEYGDSIDKDEMLDIIVSRLGRPFDEKSWFGYFGEEHFHRSNFSERGPHGLLRHQIGRGCVSHGHGTWDCIVGTFS